MYHSPKDEHTGQSTQAGTVRTPLTLHIETDTLVRSTLALVVCSKTLTPWFHCIHPDSLKRVYHTERSLISHLLTAEACNLQIELKETVFSVYPVFVHIHVVVYVAL